MKCMTPNKAVKLFCLDCMNGSRKEIELCPSDDCPLYKHRLGKGRVPLKTIHRMCMGCGEGTWNAIKHCDFDGGVGDLCLLYPWRLGRRNSPKYGSSLSHRPAMENAIIKRRVAFTQGRCGTKKAGVKSK